MREAWSAAERAAHRDGEPGLERLVGELRTHGAVWLRGGPGRGKTHWLRQVAAAMAEADDPDRASLFVALDCLDLTAPAEAEWALAEALADAGSKRGRLLQPVPDFEWLQWLDRGPGALLTDQLDAAFLVRFGHDVREARRRLGPAEVARELAAYAMAHDLRQPALLSGAERLVYLLDQLGEPQRPLLFVLDNLDALPPGVVAGLLSGLMGDLPVQTGRPIAVLAAADSGPPQPVAGRLTEIRLPRLPWAVVELPDAAMDEALRGLLEDLAEAHPEPLAFIRQVVDEGCLLTPARPLLADHLLASPTLQHWLSERLPRNFSALSGPGSGGQLAQRLLLFGAAGRPAEAPLQLLDELSAAQRETIMSSEHFDVNDRLQLRPPDREELAVFQACRAVQADLPARELLALREARLERFAAQLARSLVWDNVTYAGEVICGPAVEPDWLAPLPAERGWRLGLVTRPVPLPRRVIEPRLVILAPSEWSPEELPELRQAAALVRVAETHADSQVRARAASSLAASEPASVTRAAACLLAGTAAAAPDLPSTWQESLAMLQPAGWVAALFRSRFAVLHRGRAKWLNPDGLDEPLRDADLERVWQALRVGGQPDEGLAATGLSLDREPPGMVELRERLVAQSGVLPGPETIRRLTAPPHGLTIGLAKLYLLALVLRSEPPLLLEAGTDGPGPEVYNARRLRTAAWAAIPAHAIRRIRRAGGRGWDELRPFVQPLAPDIVASDSPAGWEAERQRLLEALAETRGETHRTSHALQALATDLQQELPEVIATALRNVEQACSAESVEAFDRSMTNRFAGDAGQWVAALERVRAAAQVASAADDLREVWRRVQARRLEPLHPLEIDRLAVLGQLSLDRLLQRPALLRSLLGQAEQCDRQYARAYRAAHARHHEMLAGLETRWSGAAAMANALARLNEVTQLGPAEGEADIAALQALRRAVRPCGADGTPYEGVVCPECGWQMADGAPIAEFEVCASRLDAAFKARTGRLRLRLTEELVRQHGTDRLEALHQVLALQQAAALPEVLSDETVALLRDCLPELSGQRVLDELRRRWPEVGPEDVDDVAADLAALLREALAAADDGDGPPRIGLA